MHNYHKKIGAGILSSRKSWVTVQQRKVLLALHTKENPFLITGKIYGVCKVPEYDQRTVEWKETQSLEDAGRLKSSRAINFEL